MQARFPVNGKKGEKELDRKITGFLGGETEENPTKEEAEGGEQEGNGQEEEEDEGTAEEELPAGSRKVRFSPNPQIRYDSGSGEWSDVNQEKREDLENQPLEEGQIDLEGLINQGAKGAASRKQGLGDEDEEGGEEFEIQPDGTQVHDSNFPQISTPQTKSLHSILNLQTPKPPGAYFSPQTQGTSSSKMGPGLSNFKANGLPSSSFSNSLSNHKPKSTASPRSPPLNGIPSLRSSPGISSIIGKNLHSRSPSSSFAETPRNRINGDSSVDLGILNENPEEEEEEEEDTANNTFENRFTSPPKESTPPRSTAGSRSFSLNSSVEKVSPLNPGRGEMMKSNLEDQKLNFEEEEGVDRSERSLNVAGIPGTYSSPSVPRFQIRLKSSNSKHPLSDVPIEQEEEEEEDSESTESDPEAEVENRAAIQEQFATELSKAMSGNDSLRISVEKFYESTKALNESQKVIMSNPALERSTSSQFKMNSVSNQITKLKGNHDNESLLQSQKTRIEEAQELEEESTNQLTNLSNQLKHACDKLLNSFIYPANPASDSSSIPPSSFKRNVLLFSALQIMLILGMWKYAHVTSEILYQTNYHDPFQPFSYHSGFSSPSHSISNPSSNYLLLTWETLLPFRTSNWVPVISFPSDWISTSQDDLPNLSSHLSSFPLDSSTLDAETLRRRRQDQIVLMLTGDPTIVSTSTFALSRLIDIPLAAFKAVETYLRSWKHDLF